LDGANVSCRIHIDRSLSNASVEEVEAFQRNKIFINIMANPEIPQKSPIVQKMEPGTYFWCTCGRSAGQPFCDGSHKGTEFSPKKVEIEEPKQVAWCACKHSKNAPFCDGSHAGLS